MDKSVLQKYETQLAAIWRLWSQFRRFSKLAFNTNPRHLKKLLEIANLYASNRRFWATNNPKYLSSALTSYFALRNDWLHQAGGHLNTGLEISGWSDRSSFLKIKRALGTNKIRRVFRPDVWYLRGGSGGFFSGFIIKAPLSEFSKIMNSLTTAGHAFEMKLPQDSITKLDPTSVGRLESINPRQGQRGLNWYSTFHISPRDFTWLVEAASDKEVAELALATFRQFGDFDFGGETLRCVAKYCLVLGFIPTGIRIRGWSLTPVKKPHWIEIGTHSSSTVIAKKSRVSPKYFEAKNVSVTNGGVLLMEESFIDWDAAQNPSLDFVAGNHNSVIGSTANTGMCFVRNVKSGEKIETAILLGSRVDSNWFHFLIETLPRLVWLNDTVPSAVPVVVSSRIPNTALEALKLVTEREVKLVDVNQLTSVKRAFVPGPTVYHPDSQFLWNREDVIEVHTDALLEIRTKILAQVRPVSLAKKTYWFRNGSLRVVRNERVIRRELARSGFRVESPSELSFEDQIRSIYESATLVTQGGAAMSNFIFAKSGAKIVVLVSTIGTSYPLPQILGSVSGAEIILIGGKTRLIRTLRSVLEQSHSSFRINPKALRAALGSEGIA